MAASGSLDLADNYAVVTADAQLDKTIKKQIFKFIYLR
jgi:hypothetical protein